jgi:hypothetical protein
MTRFLSENVEHASLKWCFCLGLIVALIFMLGAPSGSVFSWPDSPRHALNGAFVMDLIGAAPFDDPKGWAYNYYSRYPALTILFYPPLFSFLLAPFYAIFGVSQDTAVLVLFICYSFFVCGSYFFARQWLSAPLSFRVALIMAAAPELAYWGRMVMLEIPAFALLVWSAYFLVRHLNERRIGFLYLSIALLVLGAYTKISIAFIGVPYLIALFHSRGMDLMRDRHSYIIAALGIVGLVPLILLTMEFGQANVQSAAGVADSRASRLAISGWIWYAQKLPSQIGWPALLAASGFFALRLWPRDGGRPQVRHSLFLVSWFVFGYLFFSSIDLKEARHSVFLLLPVALFAGLACHHLFNRNALFAALSLLAIGTLTLAMTLFSRPVHYVDGYRDVVDFVAGVTPRDSNVLFSGYRDGAFIFNMRAHANRPDISVIRADKLLLRIAVRRELGVAQQSYDEAEIAKLINKMGVHYVVAQPDFWIDLNQMARLQAVLRGTQFEEVKRFKMRANYNSQEKELVIYRNLGSVAAGPVDITNELPIIERSVSGTLENKK